MGETYPKLRPWTLWLEEPPPGYCVVEVKRDGESEICRLIPCRMPPSWNVSGVWWRLASLPGDGSDDVWQD